MCVHACVGARARARVCVCVTEIERERVRACVCVPEREREGETHTQKDRQTDRQRQTETEREGEEKGWLWRRTHKEHSEHGLTDVEGMTPVVVGNRTVVLLHCAQPPADHLKHHNSRS